MNNNLLILGHLLTDQSSSHLNNERLAEIVTAEVAGEDVAALYADDMQHIESCLFCAEAYSNLALMVQTAVIEMSTAAETITPQEVYTTLLLQDTASWSSPQLLQIIQELISRFPLIFAQAPASPTEISQSTIQKLLDPVIAIPADLVSAITEVVQRRLAALSLYLIGVAQHTWGQNLDIKVETSPFGHLIHFQPGPKLVIPTLSGQEASHRWPLLSRRIGSPVPYHLEARAERVSDLACQLVVRIDRPGLRHTAGRQVEIRYSGVQETAVTNTQGIVTFLNVPIAAITQIEILFTD